MGRDGKTAYERQKRKKCDIGVVPFGETVLYRMPEVARDRHQALEERWAKGVWLGHARSSPEILIGAEHGVVKAWAIKRLAGPDQWEGDRIEKIKGSPSNWTLDCSGDPQLIEIEDEERGEIVLPPRSGGRAGEKRSKSWRYVITKW